MQKPFQWTGQEKVTVTRNRERGGPMMGRNQMMVETDADVFVGLDDDSYFLDPDVIEKACAVFLEKPRAGALYFEVLMEGYRDWETDRKSTRLNSSHYRASRMPSSA